MNYLKIALYVTVLAVANLISGIGVQAQTTVTAPAQGPISADLSQRTKGEVDLLIEEMAKNNEPIIRGCIENCSDLQTSQRNQVTVGEAVDKVIPVYPQIAMAARATGNVVVMMVIDEGGRVIAAQSVSGHPLLQSASVKAAKDSTFMPTFVGGVPVKVVATITYRFVMQ